MSKYVKVAGTGSYLPGEPVPYDQIDYYLGPLPGLKKSVAKWKSNMDIVMQEMLDIDYYHYAIDPETREFTEDNITMSAKAAGKALQSAGLTPNDINMLIFAGPQVDQMPTVSPRLQDAMGIEFCAEMTIHSNCTSPYKAIMVAYDMITTGRYQNVMIASSNMSSSGQIAEYYNQEIAEREDILLRWFLCDGAGCIILQAASEKTDGVYLNHTYTESAGYGREPIMYDKKPAYKLSPRDIYNNGWHHIAQSYKNIIKRQDSADNLGFIFVEGIKRMCRTVDIDFSHIRYFQINLPSKHVFDLIRELCKDLGIPDNAYYSKLNKIGYCGPPMVLICLDKILREEKLKEGDYIMSFVTEVSKILQAGFILEVHTDEKK